MERDKLTFNSMERQYYKVRNQAPITTWTMTPEELEAFKKKYPEKDTRLIDKYISDSIGRARRGEKKR
jgi:hypothetical protein